MGSTESTQHFVSGDTALQAVHTDFRRILHSRIRPTPQVRSITGLRLEGRVGAPSQSVAEDYGLSDKLSDKSGRAQWLPRYGVVVCY